MKRFIAIMNVGSFINTAADRMTMQENVIYAWDGENLSGMRQGVCCRILRDQVL